MSSLIHCIYASLSTAAFREQDLPELLTQARDANARAGLTGMLLYVKGTFFQVLEGDAQAVDATFKRIALDPRHAHVTELVHEPIASRRFSEWTMAFEALEPLDAGEMIGDTDFFIGASGFENMNPRRARKLLAASERRAMIEELKRHRHQLEKLVDERTARLERANAEAVAAHKAGVARLLAEQGAKIESSKLEAMGTLAAGIAHDFNNILASILGHAELADDDLVEGSQAKVHVAKLIGGCFRARDLIARMLDFARQQPGDRVLVNIVFQVREALALLRAALPPSIELTFESGLAQETGSILADTAQITQIVMNLCINAAHAMNDRGAISVRIDPAAAIKDAPMSQPDAVCITVADTGSGMSPAVMMRIFDPFFTTKAPGKGSGLGLSIVYGVVQNLGGLIQVHSETVGTTGTRFEVFLPTIPANCPVLVPA